MTDNDKIMRRSLNRDTKKYQTSFKYNSQKNPTYKNSKPPAVDSNVGLLLVIEIYQLKTQMVCM